MLSMTSSIGRCVSRYSFVFFSIVISVLFYGCCQALNPEGSSSNSGTREPAPDFNALGRQVLTTALSDASSRQGTASVSSSKGEKYPVLHNIYSDPNTGGRIFVGGDRAAKSIGILQVVRKFIACFGRSDTFRFFT
jgi:hypothetical protein